MSSTKVKKSQIIYERLKSAYGHTSDSSIGDVFGISKQAIGKRKKKDDVDEDEIIRLFPDVNKEWLYSENFDDLKKLPVRSREALEEAPKDDFMSLVQKAHSISEKLKAGNISPESREESLRALEFAETLIQSSKELIKKSHDD